MPYTILSSLRRPPFFALLLLAGTATGVTADDAKSGVPSGIYGRVCAQDDASKRQVLVPDATIEVFDQAGKTVGQATSNARGYYALQLELIYELYPRERVLVVDSAELFANTAAVCQRLFDFIGVAPFKVQTTKVYNRGYYKETIDPLVAEQLRDHYRPYDEMLAELTGRSFRWMEREAAGNRLTGIRAEQVEGTTRYHATVTTPDGAKRELVVLEDGSLKAAR